MRRLYGFFLVLLFGGQSCITRVDDTVDDWKRVELLDGWSIKMPHLEKPFFRYHETLQCPTDGFEVYADPMIIWYQVDTARDWDSVSSYQDALSLAEIQGAGPSCMMGFEGEIDFFPYRDNERGITGYGSYGKRNQARFITIDVTDYHSRERVSILFDSLSLRNSVLIKSALRTLRYSGTQNTALQPTVFWRNPGRVGFARK